MAGTALESFGDFQYSTGPAYVKGANKIINDAQLNTYMLGRMLSGEHSQHLQGGSKIRDVIFLDETSTFRHYLPNESMSWENPQTLDQWETPWRFSLAHMSYTEEEVGLNNGSLTAEARFHKYKDLMMAKEMNLWTSMMNGLEADLWAAPDYTEMEASGGKAPLSIPALISEHAAARVDFLTDSGPSRGDHPGYDPIWAAAGGTTVQGIASATKTNWQNQKEAYSTGAVGAQSSGTGTHLFTAFDRMFKKLNFDAMPVKPGMAEASSHPGWIACSMLGSTQYENALRVNQDWFRDGDGQSPGYAGPNYRGIPVIYVRQLDTAALYTGDTASDGYGDETVTATNHDDDEAIGVAGARYYWGHSKYLKKVIHSQRFFHKKKPFFPSAQPYTLICPVNIWHNNIACSRLRLGIISPYVAAG